MSNVKHARWFQYILLLMLAGLASSIAEGYVKEGYPLLCFLFTTVETVLQVWVLKTAFDDGKEGRIFW